MINDEINVLCYLLVVGFSLSRIGILGVMTANTYRHQPVTCPHFLLSHNAMKCKRGEREMKVGQL